MHVSFDVIHAETNSLMRREDVGGVHTPVERERERERERDTFQPSTARAAPWVTLGDTGGIYPATEPKKYVKSKSAREGGPNPPLPRAARRLTLTVKVDLALRSRPGCSIVNLRTVESDGGRLSGLGPRR